MEAGKKALNWRMMENIQVQLKAKVLRLRKEDNKAWEGKRIHLKPHKRKAKEDAKQGTQKALLFSHTTQRIREKKSRWCVQNLMTQAIEQLVFRTQEEWFLLPSC
jgi:hypothetical protein